MIYPRSAGIGVGGVLVLAVAAAAFTSVGAGPQDHVLTQAEAISQFTQANPQAEFYEQGSRITRIYGPAFSHGQDVIDSAEQFVQNHSQMFGVAAQDLIPGGLFEDGRHVQPIMYDADTDTYKFTGVYYTQTEGGIPVFRSELTLLFRNQADYPLVLAGADLRDLGNFQVDAKVAARVNIANAQKPAQAQLGREAEMTAPALVIWAGVDDMVVQPRLAVEYEATQGDPTDPDNFQKRLFLVDAETGAVLYQEDLILSTDVVGNVSGMATQGVGADICDPEALEPMPYARVNIVGGQTVFADENGDFVIPNGGNTQVTVESPVRGQWFNVINEAGPETVLSQFVAPPGPADFVHNETNTSEHMRAEVNAYIQANVVRDFTLSFNPDYPVIANQQNFTVNVNRNASCNATYSGASINFYHAAGGCPNTANSTIVHHEYGHHLVAVAGSGQGAYGEGLGDVMGVLITDQSELALGFFGNCDQPLRNADNNVQYPCNGPIHDCGRLLSGSVWDTRNELAITNPDTYIEILANLAVNAILLHNGSNIDPSITIDFLTLDDDDDNILNGTPHYNEIAAGFGAHNMDAPKLSLLDFSFPDGLPDNIPPGQEFAVRVVVEALAFDPEPGTGVLHVDIGDGFDEFDMDVVSDNVYDAIFPATECGTTVDYFFSAMTTTAEEVFFPAGAPGDFLSTLSADDVSGSSFEDDFESDLGWSATGNASTGQWQRGIPVDCNRGDPPTDGDGSSRCYLTENDAGDCDSDVDGGSVTLTSPIMDATEAASISYWRWYSNTFGNAPNQDIFVVEVSDDGGSSWVNLETVGPGGPEADGGWNYKEFTVASVVDLTDQFRIRFTASDLGDGSVVEAAVDGVRLSILDCGDDVFGDLDGDGEVGISDMLILLAEWGPCADCDDCPADLDGDCTVGLSDLLLLLENWG